MSLLNHPMVTQEHWDHFTETEHQTWNTLFTRQSELLVNRAVSEVQAGMEKLGFSKTHIPKISELNEILERETGFSIVPVKGFISESVFFQFLSERKFPSTGFIRRPDQLDYLEEPDIFHDIFGHVPLLVHPVFANFMEVFGRKSLEAKQYGLLKFATTLYWFTVEFGLISTAKGLRIYGAGITSSLGESIYSLESEVPTRVKFNLLRTMKTKYHIDSFQRTYFVVESFESLFQIVQAIEWADVQEACLQFPEIEQGILLSESEKFKGEVHESHLPH